MPRIHLMHPIRPLFGMAIVFGGLVRIIDFYTDGMMEWEP